MKYELTESTQVVNGKTLYQIRALRDIEGRAKKGDLGGWVPYDNYLTQQGNCWIGEGVKLAVDSGIIGQIKDNAYITGDITFSGHLNLHGNARVDADGYAHRYFAILQNGKIQSNDPDDRVVLNMDGGIVMNGNTHISQNLYMVDPDSHQYYLHMYGDTQLDCELSLKTDLWLSGDETIRVPPTHYYSGDYGWSITITPKYIQIGCEYHTAEEWWAFDDATIDGMGDDEEDTLAWWNENKETIFLQHQDQVDALEALESTETGK